MGPVKAEGYWEYLLNDPVDRAIRLHLRNGFVEARQDLGFAAAHFDAKRSITKLDAAFELCD